VAAARGNPGFFGKFGAGAGKKIGHWAAKTLNQLIGHAEKTPFNRWIPQGSNSHLGELSGGIANFIAFEVGLATGMTIAAIDAVSFDAGWDW